MKPHWSPVSDQHLQELVREFRDRRPATVTQEQVHALAQEVIQLRQLRDVERRKLAGQAMQGMVTWYYDSEAGGPQRPHDVASMAIAFADAMLDHLTRPK